MKVVMTTTAQERLAEIEEFIEQRDPAAALRSRDTILAKVQKLEDLAFARLGRKAPEIDDDQIREVIVTPYRIVYRLRTDSLLEILTIFYGRQEAFPLEDVLDGE